ncbi:Senescence regulator S40 [Sesbania bispinosa]|nr:Senescence regulator S40 [Sesbania bispinosa]
MTHLLMVVIDRWLVPPVNTRECFGYITSDGEGREEPRWYCKLNEEGNDNDAMTDDEDMLPPHEIMARKSTVSPILACSVS